MNLDQTIDYAKRLAAQSGKSQAIIDFRGGYSCIDVEFMDAQGLKVTAIVTPPGTVFLPFG